VGSEDLVEEFEMEGVGEAAAAGNPCKLTADLSWRVVVLLLFSLAVGEGGTVGLFWGELTLAPSLRISIYTIKSSRTELGWEKLRNGELNKKGTNLEFIDFKVGLHLEKESHSYSRQ